MQANTKNDMFQDLLEYLNSIRERVTEHFAFYVFISDLRPYNRQPHHIKHASSQLKMLLEQYNGKIFPMKNGDIVALGDNLNGKIMEGIMQTVRKNLPDDPLTKPYPKGDKVLYCLYNLAHDFEKFLEDIQPHSEELKLEPVKFHQVKETGEAMQVATNEIKLTSLVELETALHQADVSNFMRRQSICHIEGDSISSIGQEYYLSIDEVEKTLIPTKNIQANKWLFRHLTSILDKRMLPRVLESLKSGTQKSANINLCLSSILGRTFNSFDRALQDIQKNVTIEIDYLDALSDVKAFSFVRDFAKERGYNVAIDGLRHNSIGQVSLEELAYDQLKIIWSSEVLEYLLDGGRKELEPWLDRHDKNKIVLCRCDQEETLEVGASLGIQYFQGRTIERKLHKDRKV